jgi:ribosomal protein S12 methylthiotransferase accessory factor
MIDLESIRRRYGFAALVRPQVGLVDQCAFLWQELGIPNFEIATAELDHLTSLFPYITEPHGPYVRNKAIGGSGSDVDPEIAWIKAVAEAAERYATMVYTPDDFIEASATELGTLALDLQRIPRCSEREYADPKCPIRAVDPTQPIRWVRGYSLTHGQERLVPAVMTHLYVKARAAENFWIPISTGVAAHTHLAAALVTAICEVIERDAIALSWLTRLPLQRIVPPTSMPTALAEFEWRVRHSQTRYEFFDATTDVGVPTVFCVQLAEGHPTCEVSVSCATSVNAYKAYASAIREAVPARTALSGEITIPDQVADFFDLIHGAAYYGRGGHRQDFAFLLHTDVTTTLEAMQARVEVGDSDAEALRFLVGRLRDLGMEAVAVDLTTEELRDVGLWVVRVVIPDLVPMSFVHRARYLGTPRIYAYWQQCGRGTACEDNINPGPMPFA